MKILRTNNTHNDFVYLIDMLDAELNARYGIRQSEYDEHNLIAPIDTAIVGYIDKTPVACGCFKTVDTQSIEIKRMYVHKHYRRRGLAVLILRALENWGRELGFAKAILETGKGQPEAISLYKKCGYITIDNYGPYKNMGNSICMETTIISNDKPS